MSSKENSPERSSDNAQQNGESEKGKDEKPKPVGLFSPELKQVRREIAWKWLLTTVTLMAAIMAVLSLCESFINIVGILETDVQQTGQRYSMWSRTYLHWSCML